MLSVNQMRQRKSAGSKSSGTEIKKVLGGSLDKVERQHKRHRRDHRHTAASDMNDCEVCLVAQRDARIALVPCGQQRFCEACANEVERQGRGCPICRTDIQNDPASFLTFSCDMLYSQFTDKLT